MNINKYKINLKEYKLDGIKLLIAALFAFYVLYGGWDIFTKTDLYNFFQHKYTWFTFKIIQSISEILGYQVALVQSGNYVQYIDKAIELKLPFRSYYIFVAACVFLFTIPFRNWVQIPTTLIFVVLFIAFRAAAKTIIELIYLDSVHHVLLIWIETSVNIVLFFIAFSVVKYNNLLHRIYEYINLKFSEHLKYSLHALICFLIVFHAVPRMLLTYFADWMLEGLVAFTLNVSKLILLIFGITTSISGKYIFLHENWLSLERTCLGIGVMTIASILIVATKTKLINKTLYLILFFAGFVLSNSIRLAGLLVYMHRHYDSRTMDLGKLHDDVSLLLYLVAFAGIIIYILWFGDLNLKKLYATKKKQ